MAGTARLRWYKNRLQSMSCAEIVFRVRESLKRTFDRLHAQRRLASPRDYGALPRIPGLASNLDRWKLPFELEQQWSEDAKKAQSLSFDLFAVRWPRTSLDALWHLDPVSQSVWPNNKFCFDIDYRHAADRGDVKYVWEINRLQYLQSVAALSYTSKNVALAKLCLAHIESWIDNNPPFQGVNWCSGIELALRAVSIVTVTTLTDPYISRELRSKIWACLHDHATWIERYPSRFSSANNHRAAEGLGLFLLGAVCPPFNQAKRWKHAGWEILCEAAESQILPDGVGAEQAVAYSASVLETLLTGLHIARHTNTHIPPAFERKLGRAGEYLRWLCDAGGETPKIGDDDNACVFGTHRLRDRYPSSVLGALSSSLRRSDLVPPHITAHFRQAIFGPPLDADFFPYGVRHFSHGGMTIGRHKRRQGDVLLAFDHGPLGYLSIAAHGHADTLSVWLHLGGQPVFVDAGTYLYHANDGERAMFRASPLHNGLTVAGESTSRMAGNFNWAQKANVTVRSFASRGNFWQCEAEHDGYMERFGTRHRRSLSVSPDSGAVIEDMLQGAGQSDISINFLLHPDLTARKDGDEICISKGEIQILRLRHVSNLKTTIYAQGTQGHGWYSPEFGYKTATTRLSFSGALEEGEKVATHLFWGF